MYTDLCQCIHVQAQHALRGSETDLSDMLGGYIHDQPSLLTVSSFSPQPSPSTVITGRCLK
jgi:hypothetical protein